MSTQINHILQLADTFGTHLNITHWAVSMRCAGNGNFFEKLRKGSDIRTKTATKVGVWFSTNWPADLEWPSDIPRPRPQQQSEVA